MTNEQLQHIADRAFTDFEDDYLNRWGSSWRARDAPKGHVLNQVWKRVGVMLKETLQTDSMPDYGAHLDGPNRNDIVVRFGKGVVIALARVKLDETATERGTRVHKAIEDWIQAQRAWKPAAVDTVNNDLANVFANYESPPDDMPDEIDWKIACTRPVVSHEMEAILTNPDGTEQRGVVTRNVYGYTFVADDSYPPTIGGQSLAALVITLCDAQKEIPHQMEKWRLLTPSQKDAARAEWSRQVARNVKMAKEEEYERERTQVVVDDDRWEP